MLEIVTTLDGSKTIYNSEVGESYHSRNGALQESKHVFLNAGLRYYLDKAKVLKGDEISVLEVGFGSGLNFLLSADLCLTDHINLTYLGIEAYPLSDEMIGNTGYNQYVPVLLWKIFLEKYPGSLNHKVEIEPGCQLQIAGCELLNFSTGVQYDIIYYDAFASANQPEMWNEESITHVIKFLKPGGVFVTYSVTGNLKRILKGLGLRIEKLPGAAGKREMLRAEWMA